jgi:hypothetical protein
MYDVNGLVVWSGLAQSTDSGYWSTGNTPIWLGVTEKDLFYAVATVQGGGTSCDVWFWVNPKPKPPGIP